MERSELARAIYGVAHLTGTFRLRSGAVSQEYFDKYRFEADPALLRALAAQLLLLVPPGTQVLAGLELGGVPLATALALSSGLPAAFVRKAPKTYGTCRLAEGAEVTGRRVLVVEDVITTGGQVVASARQLRELGAELVGVLCVIDRGAGGREQLAAAGLSLRSLFTMDELSAAAAG